MSKYCRLNVDNFIRKQINAMYKDEDSPKSGLSEIFKNRFELMSLNRKMNITRYN